MNLKFIGIGSCFNSELGNTSAYIELGNQKILFDCGELIFAKLKESYDFWNEGFPIHVFITHNHPDHIGSLGSFIFYSFFIKKTPVFVYGNADLKQILTMMGVYDSFYTFIDVDKQRIHHLTQKSALKDEYTIASIPTKHSKNITSVGYLIKDDYLGSCYYFGGDSCEIPEIVLSKFKEGKINRLYLDVSWLDYPDNVHLSYKKLKEVIDIDRDRDKVYIMHLDENFNVQKAKQDGFNIATK